MAVESTSEQQQPRRRRRCRYFISRQDTIWKAQKTLFYLAIFYFPHSRVLNFSCLIVFPLQASTPTTLAGPTPPPPPTTKTTKTMSLCHQPSWDEMEGAWQPHYMFPHFVSRMLELLHRSRSENKSTRIALVGTTTTTATATKTMPRCYQSSGDEMEGGTRFLDTIHFPIFSSQAAGAFLSVCPGHKLPHAPIWPGKQQQQQQ